MTINLPLDPQKTSQNKPKALSFVFFGLAAILFFGSIAFTVLAFAQARGRVTLDNFHLGMLNYIFMALPFAIILIWIGFVFPNQSKKVDPHND